MCPARFFSSCICRDEIALDLCQVRVITLKSQLQGSNILTYAKHCLSFALISVLSFLESSMSSKTPTISRRNVFAGAATVGVVAAASSVLPSLVQNQLPVAPAMPKPERGGGYTLSEHVQQYYKTTRI